MRRAVAVAFAALLAAGCDREPVRTVVIPPRAAEPAPQAAAPGAGSGPLAVVPAPDTPRTAQPKQPPPAVTGAAPAGDAEGAALLAGRRLIVPVAGVSPRALVDTYEQSRGARRHEAIDILAPRGTPVYAVDDGKVAKLFRSVPGGMTVYQFDPQGRLAYYYAHLDGYAAGLAEGRELRRGDLVGYVGISGNASPQTPHLHFAVFRLGPQKQWWKGEPVNPYPALSNAAPAGAGSPVATASRGS